MKLALIFIVILPVVTCFIRSSLSSTARNGLFMSSSDTYALLFDCDGKY